MNSHESHTDIEEKIVAHFYMDETLSSDDLNRIKRCDQCTQYFTQIKNMASTDLHQQPDDHYWRNYYDRLEERLDTESKPNVFSILGRIKLQYVATAAILLIFIGFNLGKYLYQPVDVQDVVSNIDAMEVENLVTRSRVLFTQFNQLDEFNARFFLESQVKQSNELLLFTSYLRKKHEHNPTLHSFIGEIEKVLLSMKSIENEDIYAIKSIQGKLFAGQMIAKLDYIRNKELE